MKYILFIFTIIFLACNSNTEIQEEESFLEIFGNKIHTKSIGDGPPIILAHGGYLNLDMWDPQIDVLSKTNKVIRFSDLGHGKSKSSGEKIFGHQIIQKLLSNSEHQKSTLIGLSWGAMLCVDYTLNHPKKVEQLILLSPGLNGWDYFQDSNANHNYQLRQKAVANSDTLKAAKLFHKNWVIGPQRKPKNLDQSFLDSSLEMIQHTMSNHWQSDWSQLDSIKAIHRLNEITVPTYIIIGKEDAKDILQIADLYDKQIANSEKIIIENAAHLINMEHPKKINALLKKIIH